MLRRIEILDTTLRDGNKLPFAVLSPKDRLLLAAQLARLGVDVIEAGFPAASSEEADCVRAVCREIHGPFIGALARALPEDVEKALEALSSCEKPHLHVFMSMAPQFLEQVLRKSEAQSLESLRRCVERGVAAGVRVQFSVSEAPHAPPEYLRDACLAAAEAGASIINLADTNGILSPEDAREMVRSVAGLLAAAGKGPRPVLGVHFHNDLGLATANTLAAIEEGASHVESTIGGFGERAGNAATEEIAFALSVFGEKRGVSHGIRLDEIAATARLFDSLTGVRTHPNKPVIGKCAFVPSVGGFAGKSLPPALRDLMSEAAIGRKPGGEAPPPEQGAQQAGPYLLESFNVLSGSDSPPVGIVVIRREGRAITQSSHGNGPIDALFSAVDKALGFSTRMVLYSVSTLATGTEALTEVIVTAELRGRRFHGRHTSTNVIEASLRAYMMACNEIGLSGILDGPSEFHVAGEYLWE